MRNVPGAIVTTRTPIAARSRAAGSVMPTMPPFAAEYAAWPILPSKAAIDDGHDDDAALVVLERFFLRHLRGREAHHVERADEERLDGDREALVGGRACRRGRRCDLRPPARPPQFTATRNGPWLDGDPDDLLDLLVVLDVAAHELGLAAELGDDPLARLPR